MGERAVGRLRSNWEGIVVEPIRRIKAQQSDGRMTLAGETFNGTNFDTRQARPTFPDLFNQFGFDRYQSMYPRPFPLVREGNLIFGRPEIIDEKRSFAQWWVADSKFAKMLAMIRSEPQLTEHEMGIAFHTPEHHDLYWALLRLVFFDNVQAFVDCARFHASGKIPYPDYTSKWSNVSKIEELEHPGFGFSYSNEDHINWYGMWLPTDVSHLLHEWSWLLDSPEWWDEYVQKMGSFMRYRMHRSDVCRACQGSSLRVGL